MHTKETKKLIVFFKIVVKIKFINSFYKQEIKNTLIFR